MHNFEIEDLIESLKNIMFNTNDPCEKLHGLQFLKMQMISSQLHIDLGDNTF